MSEYRETISLPVSEQYNGVRIDRFLAEEAENLTRSMAQKLCDSGLVMVGQNKYGRAISYPPERSFLPAFPSLNNWKLQQKTFLWILYTKILPCLW